MLKPTPAQDLELIPKFVLYGSQGDGKTRWVAENCPKPAVWIDFERSSDTILTAGIPDIDVIPITPTTNPREVEEFCKNIDKSKYKTLVFDTISTSQIYQLNHWMENDSKNKGGDAGWSDFRRSTTIFNRIFMQLQHAKIAVVLIAHERVNWEGEGEFRKKVSVGPSVTPGLQESVTQLVSAVLRLTKKSSAKPGEQPQRVLLCNSKGLYIAKNRYGITEMELVNPTWDSLLKGN